MAKGKTNKESSSAKDRRPTDQDQSWSIDDVDLPPQMTGETTKAYHAFGMYSRQPPHNRSLRKVATRQGKTSKRQLEKWSSKWTWVIRLKAYDAAVEKSRARAWHRHRSVRCLAQLEMERRTQERARGVLLDKGVDVLAGILTGRDGDGNAVLVKHSDQIAASREIREIAKHDPDRPVEPPDVGGASDHDFPAAFRALEAMGVSRQAIRQMIAQNQAKLTTTDDD